MYPTATPPLVLNERVPDPAVKVLDKSFEKYRRAAGERRTAVAGLLLGRGAGLFRRRAVPACGATSRTTGSCAGTRKPARPASIGKPSNYANGNTRDRQGRLVTAEHGRRVTRTEYDGRITVLMDRFEGKRLNSPNDIVVKSDDSIWFTDMNAGIDRQLERRDRRAGIAAAGLSDRRQDRAGDASPPTAW